MGSRKGGWLPIRSFQGTAKSAQDQLADQNLVFLAPEFKIVKAQVNALTKFPKRLLATQPGWTASSFALQSGQVIGRAGKRKATATFHQAERRDAVAGSLTDWRGTVAAPLADHKLASFIMMIPFTAPLLRIIDYPTNFGFELSGEGGIGKTTICQLAASVSGPMDDMIVSMNSTANAIDQLMCDFRDHTLILEEWNMFALQGGGRAGQQAASLAFSLGDGVSKRRLNGPVTERSRLIWLTSSNRPFPELVGSLQRDTANAAMDRMITLTIGDDRSCGIFDDRFADPGDVGTLAAQLIQAAHEQHGLAMVEYLKQLTTAHAEFELDLRAYIKRRQKRFVTKVKDIAPASMNARVAEAFGLVFAAGELAKRFGVLPTSYNCLKAAKLAYRLHLASRAAIATPVERLLALLDCPNVLDLREISSSDVTTDMIDAASAMRWSVADKDGELLLTAAQLRRLTPDKPGFLKDSVIRGALLTEKDRLMAYRYTHGKHGRRRCYCFQIALLRDQGHM